MKNYTLYNKKLDRQLVHPKIGLWFTNNYQEAEEMLQSCHEYVDAMNMSFLKDNFQIVELTEDQSPISIVSD